VEFACQSMFENLIIYFSCINLVLDFLGDRTVSHSKILMGGGLRSIPKFQVDLVDTGPLENSSPPVLRVQVCDGPECDALVQACDVHALDGLVQVCDGLVCDALVQVCDGRA